jgi:MoaA/NifB/PqqE/SkfB family radical SAM enzyme
MVEVERRAPHDAKTHYVFTDRLRERMSSYDEPPLILRQINVGKLCNQACLHCHVEAGPNRTEIMDRRTAELALEFVQVSGGRTVDITGGAPELNPSFRFLVEQARNDGRYVMDRCNLTVLFESGQEDLPEFLANHQVEVWRVSLLLRRECHKTARTGSV